MNRNFRILTAISAIAIIVIVPLAYYYIIPSLTGPGTSTQPPVLQKPAVLDARNWAGYIVATNLQNPQPSIIGITASWTVPLLTDIGVDAFSAVWIGIGGQFDHTLIQIGTEQDSIAGEGQYSAWYEMLPNDSITIDTLTITPGDQITASICLADSNTNRWTINITDITTSQVFRNDFTYNSEQLSAEWILERPNVDGQISELADFGNITFTNCQAYFTTKTGAINDFPSTQVIMDQQLRHNQLVQLVSVSALNSQGTAFTVKYLL